MNSWTSSLDKNHREIVAAFRERGAAIIDTSKVGDGFPDILVKVGYITALVEIKMPSGKLSSKQLKWHNEHSDWLVFIVHDIVEVDRVIYDLRKLQEVQVTITNPVYECPHGFFDSDLCPVCCH